ncbi:MAG TPA: 4'-phosphopantetheinyl transferase superfamily protein [Candidatus Eisenbacteria bacterium]|nr:4'-phosphopantetheinyl transferase superfamily protein [Candidatus Eisenbacteria bacterium]
MAPTPRLDDALAPRPAVDPDRSPRYDRDSGLLRHVSALPDSPAATIARVHLEEGHPLEPIADAWLLPAEHLWWDGVPDLRQSDALLGTIALREAIRGRGPTDAGDDPKPLSILHRAGAAPRVSGDPDAHCSVAHDRDAAVAAIAHAPIGVDLVGRERFDASVLQRIASPEEVWAAGAAGVAPSEAPSLLWAVKEAVLKGVGLDLGLHPYRVAVHPDGESTWRADLPPLFRHPRRWRVDVESWSGRWIAVARPSADSPPE